MINAVRKSLNGVNNNNNNNNNDDNTCKIVEYAVPADKRVKLKESEKKDNYYDLARCCGPGKSH